MKQKKIEKRLDSIEKKVDEIYKRTEPVEVTTEEKVLITGFVILGYIVMMNLFPLW